MLLQWYVGPQAVVDLPIHVDEVFDLSDYPKALERLTAATQLGKIVLRHS